MLGLTEREKSAYVPRHHPQELQSVQLQVTGFDRLARVMDQFDHHGFLAHPVRDTAFLGHSEECFQSEPDELAV